MALPVVIAGLRPPVIHRDIKPENVVLEGNSWTGRVYLIDFGGVQGSSGLGERTVPTMMSRGTWRAVCDVTQCILLQRYFMWMNG